MNFLCFSDDYQMIFSCFPIAFPICFECITYWMRTPVACNQWESRSRVPTGNRCAQRIYSLYVRSYLAYMKLHIHIVYNILDVLSNKLHVPQSSLCSGFEREGMRRWGRREGGWMEGWRHEIGRGGERSSQVAFSSDTLTQESCRD